MNMYVGCGGCDVGVFSAVAIKSSIGGRDC